MARRAARSWPREFPLRWNVARFRRRLRKVYREDRALRRHIRVTLTQGSAQRLASPWATNLPPRPGLRRRGGVNWNRGRIGRPFARPPPGSPISRLAHCEEPLGRAAFPGAAAAIVGRPAAPGQDVTAFSIVRSRFATFAALQETAKTCLHKQQQCGMAPRAGVFGTMPPADNYHLYSRLKYRLIKAAMPSRSLNSPLDPMCSRSSAIS